MGWRQHLACSDGIGRGSAGLPPSTEVVMINLTQYNQMIYCAECGAQLDESVKFCTLCGTASAYEPPQQFYEDGLERQFQKKQRTPFFVWLVAIGVGLYVVYLLVQLIRWAWVTPMIPSI
jgi:zinc-ribbon domain